MSTKTKLKLPPKSMFRGLRLDPEIFDLIRELNGAGFETYMSCAGHCSRGYISFKRIDDKVGLIKILEAYGLKNLRIQDWIEDLPLYYRGRATMVSFDRIGKPNGEIDDDIDPLDWGERQLELF